MSIEAQHMHLLELIDTMAGRMECVDTGDVWNMFSCTEIESLCAVLEAAGHNDTASFIRGEHSLGDDVDDDEHYGMEVPWRNKNAEVI